MTAWGASRPRTRRLSPASRAAGWTATAVVICAEDELLSVVTMLHQSPILLAKQHERRSRWIALLGPEVARRLGPTPEKYRRLRADAMVASVLACSEVATQAWAESGGCLGMTDAFSQALGAIRD